jgi:adenylylsulfate kinase
MDTTSRSRLMPAVWLFGLPCSGKSTLATALAARQRAGQIPVKLMDGDMLRGGLCRDLGYDTAARTENLRRAAEVSRLFLDEGTMVVAAFITPLQQHRALVRNILFPQPFLFVHDRCPVDVCARRDVKGQYARARRGEIRGFTGLDGEFEPPLSSECAAVDTDGHSVEACLSAILELLAGAQGAP